MIDEFYRPAMDDEPAAWRERLEAVTKQRDKALFDGVLIGMFVGLMVAIALLVVGIQLV